MDLEDCGVKSWRFFRTRRDCMVFEDRDKGRWVFRGRCREGAYVCVASNALWQKRRGKDLIIKRFIFGVLEPRKFLKVLL